MSIVTHTYPFDVSSGVVGQPTYRRWVGTLTWTRDLETQIVELRLQGTKSGASNSGIYIYWVPNIPQELRIPDDQYPRTDHGDFWLAPTGEGYCYIYGAAAAPIDETYRYVTDEPIVEDLPEPTGDLLGDLNAIVEQVGVPVYPGYAPSGVALPYIVTRPIDVGIDDDPAVAGNITDWNLQLGVYCVAAGVQASFNLALAVMGLAQGAWMRGTTLAASMGYNGAEIEGNYESQVTIQLNQGALA